ncbi:hypothetical protein AHMF7605_03055 [Adhaeribacter arboris]|uniref:DUF4625 domain-containing protein n=1 Tax=Adhaeribacter arboris TaxID=2072846 RepID=A0A2T2YAN0_9BACT|nr:Ig-like domain-containing protein [Adhaeribacter arboris]PSR52575.1 hypothetical protein AHMF7605_03055 [Adhaeribacter arboris]
MIQKHLLNSVLAVVLFFFLASCEELFDTSDTKPDGSAPAVRLEAPQNNSVFSLGNNVPIKSVISDKDRIKEMEVQVVLLADGSANQTVWGYKKNPTTNPVIVDTTINTAVLTPGNYLLRMNLVDNRTNSKVKEVFFSVK